MKRKDATIIYCHRCSMTTPHSIAGSARTCKRCGAVKTADGVTHVRNTVGLTSSTTDSDGHWN